MAFDDNPAFVVLVLLQASGWDLADVDLPSIMDAAAYCDEDAGA